MSSISDLRLRLAFVAVVGALLASACANVDESQRQAIVPDPTSTSASETSGAGSGSGYDDSFNFTATTFDGETFELAAHKGTPVVINFWESW